MRLCLLQPLQDHDFRYLLVRLVMHAPLCEVTAVPAPRCPYRPNL